MVNGTKQQPIDQLIPNKNKYLNVLSLFTETSKNLDFNYTYKWFHKIPGIRNKMIMNTQ